jgi:galactose mutarotase-like enzyme
MGVPTEVDLTLHGKIANIPASFVQVEVFFGDPPEVAVIGEIYEAALFFPQYRLRTRISTRVGSNSFTIADEVTNLAAVEAELELLYHCNFGGPFLEEGSRLVVPARVVAPRTALDASEIEQCHTYLGPTAGYIERAYWHELFAREDASTAAMLRNAAGDRAVVLRFSIKELPTFAQWKNTTALSDGYVTGLEPGTDYPNSRTFEREQGRVKILEPGETHRSTVTLEVHDSSSAIRAVEKEIAAIQQNRETIVYTEPNPRYSPLD